MLILQQSCSCSIHDFLLLILLHGNESFQTEISRHHSYYSKMKILFKNCNRLITALVIALSTEIIIINNNNVAHALNVLVVGGSGRVGGSTVRWIKTLSDRQQQQQNELDALGPAIITVGGRRRESYEAALRNNVIPPEVDFLSLDVDGDEILLQQTLQQWQSSCNENDNENQQQQHKKNNKPKCLVVHTGGPFQGRTKPTLLSTCLSLSIPYVDVCDEWELAETSKSTLHSIAREKNVPCIISCGIWPGVSALMAKEGAESLASKLCSSYSNDVEGTAAGDEWTKETKVEIESIDYSFFTAGTGNAGPTIVSATFLLLATPVITFLNGLRADKEPWTEMKQIDFGKGVGNRLVWLLDNPDVPSTALYLNSGNQHDDDDTAKVVPNVSSRFGTAPLVWNYLFGGMKVLPRSLLYNRNAMQAFALFSEPIIRLVDRLVGATNAMRVDVTGCALRRDGTKVGRETITLRVAHDDLEMCVGLATAAFALEVARSMYDFGSGDGATPTVLPGVFFPVELGKRARENILEVVKEDAFVYELGK